MNFFDHKDLGNHLLQLCPKVVKHPVYIINIEIIRFLKDMFSLARLNGNESIMIIFSNDNFFTALSINVVFNAINFNCLN